jgi:hypothetical protein
MKSSVYQTVVCGVSPGGPQVDLEEKALKKCYQTRNE